MTTHWAYVCITVAIAITSAPSVLAQGLSKNTSTSNFVHPKSTNGEKDMLILGKAAKSFGTFVTIQGVHITLYPMTNRDSQIELFSPKASYAISQEKATSSARVNIRIYPRPLAPKPAKDTKSAYNTIIDGVGFDLMSKLQSLRIRSKVKVRMIPVDTATSKPTVTITSKQLSYDVLKHLITFTGAVKVTSVEENQNKRFSLDCETLTIITDQHGQPTTMTADKSVTLQMNDDTATSEKAVFRKMSSPPAGEWPNPGKVLEYSFFNRFILSGNPVVKTGPQVLKNADKVIIDQSEKDRRMQTSGGKPVVILEKSETGSSIIPSVSAGSQETKQDIHAPRP